jgi:cytochrome b561
MDIPGYSTSSKAFHWLTVILLVIQYAVGWLMPHVRRDTLPIGLISWHISVGILVIVVVVLRLVWRWTHAAPPPLPAVSPFMQTIANWTHGLLYLFAILIPVMGWANASARGWQLSFFGLLPLPAIGSKGSPLIHAFGQLHSLFAWILLGLIALHVLAALFHHLIVKDDTLRRMLP